MDIRSGLEGLKSLLGVPQATTPAFSAARPAATGGANVAGSDRATLSQAASQAAQTSATEDARPEKVAAIQAALASGAYSVSGVDVASCMIDAMLAGTR